MMIKPVTKMMEDDEADTLGLLNFHYAMHTKLLDKRVYEERGGWHTSNCTNEELRKMLADNLERADMVDVANLAMMIWNREHMAT